LNSNLQGGIRVFAVIVCFEPVIDELSMLLSRLVTQVEGIVIIDNGSSNAADLKATINRLTNDPTALKIISEYLASNVGLAAAQNVGIGLSKDCTATHVILFDQDSLPATDMLTKLKNAEQGLLLQGIDVAAVGPCYFDERQKNPPPFISIIGLRLIRHSCENRDSPIPVDYLIASGALIRIAVLDHVGQMRADFFIDYIDIEWGLRARKAGFFSFGVCDAKMSHCLGDSPLVWRGRSIPLHSPLRHYFHFRNAVRLYCERNAPVNWKLVDGYRLVLKFGFYSLCAKPRLKHFTSMLAGIRDGLFSRSGDRKYWP
jgi:rhamnosyltransferase